MLAKFGIKRLVERVKCVLSWQLNSQHFEIVRFVGLETMHNSLNEQPVLATYNGALAVAADKHVEIAMKCRLREVVVNSIDLDHESHRFFAYLKTDNSMIRTND